MEEDEMEKPADVNSGDDHSPTEHSISTTSTQQLHHIYEVANKRTDESEHLLPVHFLPEGKKCYDWINQDLQKNENTLTTVCGKDKSTTVNSITYHSSHIDTGNMDVNKKQIVQNLLSAAEHGDLEEVKGILKSKPLYINGSDSDGYTPLHRACYSGHENVVVYLLEHGGCVHSRTDDDWQPLHCAARWNQTNICKILLDKKADVNATTKGKQTPLHFAALTSDSQAILEMFLLHPDINATIRNAAEDTAYEVAFRSGPHYRMFELVDEGLKI